MKLTKILYVALAALTLTACSDDDNDYNTAPDVTVSMNSAAIEVRENTSLFNVPFTVSGKPNGPLVVYVETSPVGENPAKDIENYIVTSQRIIVDPEEGTGYVQIAPVDDLEENESRTFNVTITRVEGGSIGTLATTTVTLRDNDNDPYEKITGAWTFTAFSYFDQAPVTYSVNIGTPDPEDPDEAPFYGNELYVYGIGGRQEFFLPFRNFEWDELTETGSMDVAIGDIASTAIFNVTGLGPCYLICTGFTGTSYTLSGTIHVTFDSSLDEIHFPDLHGGGFGLGWVPRETGVFGGSFNGIYVQPTLVRAK